MSTPTIEQRCDAQDYANAVMSYALPIHFLTADELRRVLGENEEQARLLGMSAERECALRGKLERAQKKRDQWRECARKLARNSEEYQSRCPADEDFTLAFQRATNDLRAALARFDALVKEEKP